MNVSLLLSILNNFRNCRFSLKLRQRGHILVILFVKSIFKIIALTPGHRRHCGQEDHRLLRVGKLARFAT
jgi:hypothetical protein